MREGHDTDVRVPATPGGPARPPGGGRYRGPVETAVDGEGTPEGVVVDTNVFVAAAFNPGSASARLVRALRSGELRLVWDDATRDETRRVLERIPGTRWGDVRPLYARAGRHVTRVDPAAFRDVVEDPADRPFAALARSAGAVLVSSDAHLLDTQARAGIVVRTPSDHLRRGARP